MELRATIVGINQALDLKDNSVTNLLVLELPNGTRIQGVISDASAKDLVQLALVGESFSSPLPPFPTPPSAFVPSPPSAAENASFIFGGNQPVQPAQPETQMRTARPVMQMPSIEVDDRGNPIMRNKPRAPDPAPDAVVDEDGIEQG